MPLRFPDLAEEGLGFDGLGFVSLDPAMMCGNGEGMEVRMRCIKDEEEEDEDEEEDDEDEDEQLREKSVEMVENF